METYTETYTFVGESGNPVSATSDATRAANELLNGEPSLAAHLAISTQLVRDNNWWTYVLTIVRSYEAS
jgi:hypothetical protein